MTPQKYKDYGRYWEDILENFDFCIIGAGIVGLSTAMQLLQTKPNTSLIVIEKEATPAFHQTGHNSGVIHAGVYYAPGSMKAKFCREGLADTIEFCKAHNVAYDQCGKLIVATSPLELERLDALEKRAEQNGLDLERLDGAALREREPHITGLGGLLVKDTGIVDYPGMSRAMVKEITRLGGKIAFANQCIDIKETTENVTVITDKLKICCQKLIVCAGLQADRLAKMAGLDVDFQIVPFRGDYYRLPASCNNITQHLIYPVPDPDLPFLGVHLTRMIDGSITVGPNACLALAREKYSRFGFSLKDFATMIGFSGLWHVVWKNRKSAISELKSAFMRSQYLKLCQKYCPSLKLSDLQPYPCGIRAQAVLANGDLVHDFLIKQTARSIHICNAPSPAATASLPIGRHIISLINDQN